jgi:hypothetical protein
MKIRYTMKLARKLLAVIDAGLVHGMGEPVPGKMCIEAAVCHALGLQHGDDPPCVGYAVRAFKISLNDSFWSSPAARAAGLRELGVAQLGSDALDQIDFSIRLVPCAWKMAERAQGYYSAAADAADARYHAAARSADAADAAAAARYHADAAIAARYAAAARYRATAAARYAAAAARYAAAAARYHADADQELAFMAMQCVGVLREMGCPGVVLLDKVLAA